MARGILENCNSIHRLFAAEEKKIIRVREF